MKKLLSVFLSNLLVFCLFIPCFASVSFPEGFTLCDLSDINIPAIVCSKAKTNPILDGVISKGEYESFQKYSKGEGFGFSDCDMPGGLNLSQETAVSADNDYFYVAVRISAPVDGNYIVSHKKLGLVYQFSLDLGMSPGDHPMERASVLHNEYYFSSETLRCVGVSGHRVYFSDKGQSAYSLQISSFDKRNSDKGYEDCNGVKWTGLYYQNNASFSVSKKETEVVYIGEFKIPVGDVLLSVSPDKREMVRDQFSKKEGVLCGSFSSSLEHSSQRFRLMLGIPGHMICPYSSETKTWNLALKEIYEKEEDTWADLDGIPIPLYLVGEPKSSDVVENAGDKASENSLSETRAEPFTSKATEPITSAENSTDSEKGKVPGESVSAPMISSTSNEEKIFSNSAPFTEEGGDESLFDDLPDGDQKIPEDTEIVYMSGKEEETEKTKEENSLLGQILLLATGVLLFASVMVFASVLGRKEKALAENTGKTENNRKKTQQKTKKTNKK